MFRARSFSFVAAVTTLSIAACSGGELAVGSSADKQQLQSRKDGKATGDGTTCSWEGTAAYDVAVSPSGPVSSNGNASPAPATTYTVGQDFKSLDGCNDCSCTANGIMCTERACSSPGGNGSSPANPADRDVKCSAEAKVCPDGTTVGRTGPNCEFAPCPSAAVIDTGRLGQACGQDPSGCPAGQSCYSFPVAPHGFFCSADPCSAIKCPAGQQCLILESFPAQIRCGK